MCWADADDAQLLVLGFDGLADDVQWQTETLGAKGVLPAAIGGEARAGLRDFSLQDAPMTCVFHILSSQVGAYSRMMEWTAARAGFAASVVSDAALGMSAHFTPLGERRLGDVLRRPAGQGGTCGRQLYCGAYAGRPAPLDGVWSPQTPDMALMRRIKEKLDPVPM